MLHLDFKEGDLLHMSVDEKEEAKATFTKMANGQIKMNLHTISGRIQFEQEKKEEGKTDQYFMFSEGGLLFLSVDSQKDSIATFEKLKNGQIRMKLYSEKNGVIKFEV